MHYITRIWNETAFFWKHRFENRAIISAQNSITKKNRYRLVHRFQRSDVSGVFLESYLFFSSVFSIVSTRGTFQIPVLWFICRKFQMRVHPRKIPRMEREIQVKTTVRIKWFMCVKIRGMFNILMIYVDFNSNFLIFFCEN